MYTFAEGAQLANDIFILGSFEDYPLTVLIETLQSADDLYTNEGESFLTDEQYDTLKQYVTASDPSNVYLTGVGSSTRGG
ncbi:MAG: hypothetical protein E4H14_02750, partial [Candidatus Thorarchaeota archaeon]